MPNALRWVAAALCAAVALLGCQPQTPRDPGAVVAAGALGTPLLLANGQSTVYARIRLSARELRDRRPRGAVNVALALDTSGSMEGAAIAETRKAALDMVAAMQDGDRLAVVSFNTGTALLLPSTELDAAVRADVARRIAAVKAEGTTDMQGGLRAALEQVRAHFADKGVNRVVLLGDGIPNDAAGIEAMAREAADAGIAISTLGLGLDYDETLMGKVAQLSGGRYRYVAGAERVAAFFREELERIDAVYGRHAVATLTAGPGVTIDGVIGTSEAGKRAVVTLGDIAAGETRDVLVRLTVTPRKAGVPIELLDAQIDFDDAVAEAGRLERRVYLGARTVLDEAEVAKARDPDVELSAALAEAAAATLRGLELSKQGSYVAARQLLTSGSQAALAQAKRTPSAALEKHAAEMAAVAKDLPEKDAPVAKPEAEMPVQPAPVMEEQKRAHQYAVDAFQNQSQ